MKDWDVKIYRYNIEQILQIYLIFLINVKIDI